METLYFMGIPKSKKFILGTKVTRDNNIKLVIDEQSAYIGGYKYLDGTVELESVSCFADFSTICTTQESIYKCNVINKVKIGSRLELDYLIATLYDLMESLTEPLQGFTVYKDHENNYHLLVCNQGEYIMNPNSIKEKQDAIK